MRKWIWGHKFTLACLIFVIAAISFLPSQDAPRTVWFWQHPWWWYIIWLAGGITGGAAKSQRDRRRREERGECQHIWQGLGGIEGPFRWARCTRCRTTQLVRKEDVTSL